MRHFRLLTGVLVLFLLANGVAFGQGVGASGDLRGTVTDPTGAVIPKATVLVEDVEKGIRRTSITDDSGGYEVTGLQPGTYRITARISGFQTEAIKDVTVNVGQTVILDFHLKISPGSETVEVTTQPPVVDTQRASQADILTQQDIGQLPIDRRDYLTLTLLAPGVSNATRLASDQDFRVKQTPQSGLSFYGSNGRGNSVTVDGGEANDDAGGVRLTLNQDAVQEFQVNRSNYLAELGGASGAAINIVSKSGTNELHGSLYSYFRNDSLDAADPFAVKQALAPGATFDPSQPDSVGSNVKNALTRYQYGGSVGFPLRKDKSFLFASFEGLRQDSDSAVPLLTNTSIFRPTLAQLSTLQSLANEGNGTMVQCFSNSSMTFPAPTCAFLLQNILTVSQLAAPGRSPGQIALNNFLINQLESNGGLFNYRTREYLASGRFDHHFSDSNQLALTYRYGHDREENPDLHSLTGFTAGSSTHTYDNNALASWYHLFSPTAQNELRLQFDYTDFNVIPNVPGEVGLQIPSFVNNLGTSIFIPNYTITRRYEIADNFTLVRGHHTMKFGGQELLRGDHTESHTFLPGRFIFGSLPGFLISPCFLPSSTTANPCGLTTQGTGINPLQSASFGLPQIFQQGFGNPVYPYNTRPWTALYWQDTWRIASSFTLNYGLRYELDTQYKPLGTYKKNFGPRVSFSWDPFNTHKTVLRAGYGIFYAPIYNQIPNVDFSLGVLNANQTSVENSSSAGQVHNLVAICGITGLFPGNGSSPCNRPISIYLIPISGVPGGGAGLNAINVFQTLFAQGTIGCTTPASGSYACITPGTAGVPTPGTLGQFGLSVTNSGPLAPLAVVFVEQPNFRNPYSQQAELGIEREVAPGFSVSASYIYSHTIGLPVAIDTNLLQAAFTAVTLANGKTIQYRNWNGNVPPGQPAAADPLGGQEVLVSGPNAGQPVVTAGYPCANPFACFVNPLIAQNNQYTSAATAVYQAGILQFNKRFSNSFTLFGNYTYSKGFDTSTDFNSDYGPQDPTNLAADRGLSEFDQRHKVVLAGVFSSPWKNPILAGFQLAPIFTYNSGHPFNLLAGGEVNGDNHTTNERPIGAGRDTGLGPDYTNFDMRLSWLHKMGEKASLQLTAEGFNIANHTNYASVNNEVSPLFGIQTTPTTCPVAGTCPTGNTTFAVHGSAALSPSTPLGFTSVFPKREIQLGLRLNF